MFSQGKGKKKEKEGKGFSNYGKIVGCHSLRFTTTGA